MIKGKSKNTGKYFKRLGVSTIIIGSAFTGYALIGQAQSTTDVDSSITVDVVEASDIAQLPAHGGRGARPGGPGGDGGHDHGGEQTLSDNAYDPSAMVTVEPNAETITVPDTSDTTDSVDTSDTTDVTDETVTEEIADATETPVVADGQVYYDGQYTGDSVSADRWGNMQVVVVVADGEIENVLIANYPRSTTRSDIITRNALPTLISETIAAQDADIDMVSGATDTSRAFIQSLESALDDAIIITDAESTN